MDLKTLLGLPSEHLHKYLLLFEAILTETAEGNPDVDFLGEAVEAMKNLQNSGQLQAFQIAMGEGPMRDIEWKDLVPEDVRNKITEQEALRQA